MLKSEEQQKANLAVTAHGQHTESGKYHHGIQKDADALDPAKEPELLKAVNYALREYPCILHCLEDGTIDFSNNCCERQIRRIAKYRNNSFFVGSPAAGIRFARLQSVFGNIRNHKLNPQIYLCDVFRRIKNMTEGTKEEMVNLLAHKWQPGLLLAK